MDKLQMQSKNLVDENIEFIAKRFPNCVTEALDEEGKLTKLVDFDMLKQELSHVVIDGDKERYTMTWPDKKQAILTANAPIAKTLRPCREESVGKDGKIGDFNSQNIYIEGDNLDVLKLLRETYLGKIKMIYIDPPYNTGNDFVYNDDFAVDTDEYLEKSNQVDDQGNRMVVNNDSNGRFHTDWLNMIYPRLKIAKDLLTEDGCIMISIDSNEYCNLNKLMEEIFGKSNYITTIAWVNNLAGRVLDRFYSETYESILVYAKNINEFKLNKKIDDTIDFETYYPFRDEVGVYRKGHEFYNSDSQFNVDTRNNLAYTIYVDKTTHEIKCINESIKEDNGYTIPNVEYDSEKYIRITPPFRTTVNKFGCWRWQISTLMELYKSEIMFDFLETKKMLYIKDRPSSDGIKYSKFKNIINGIATNNGTQELTRLIGGKFFANPKPTKLLQELLEMTTCENDTILDFFSGSGSMAEAIFKKNATDGFKRKFILVQLPEIIPENNDAFKAGYENICEIGKERIRLAGKKIKEENPNAKDLDIGFRDLKLDSSCMKDIYYSPNKTTQDLLTQFEDNIKEDRTPEDLLFQVMLDMGVMLSSEIETLEINGKKVFNVNNGDLVCCFDKNINDDVVTAIAKMQPLYAVFRDASMSTDSVAVNFDQIFETYSPTTTRKII